MIGQQQVDELLALRCHGTAPVVEWVETNVNTSLDAADVVLGCALVVGTYQRSVLNGIRALRGLDENGAFFAPALPLIGDDQVKLRVAQVCSAAGNSDMDMLTDLIAATVRTADAEFLSSLLTELIEHAHNAAHATARIFGAHS